MHVLLPAFACILLISMMLLHWNLFLVFHRLGKIHIYPTASCSELSNPANGTVRWTGLTIGSFAIYTCNAGYQRIRQWIRICMSNRM